MTTTTTARSRPRVATLSRETATRLAATEYQRFVQLLRGLQHDDWAKPTDCAGWDVHAMAAHALGMVEMAASVREQIRQNRAAKARQAQHGGPLIDALTALQVDERSGMSPEQIIARFAARAPKAAGARRRVPAFVRRRPLPDLQDVGDATEAWTFGYLIEVILTRDPWMHRVDIARATGARHVLTSDHDGVLVADVVDEWAVRHGRPYTLRLTGPAGGEWRSGERGPVVVMDAVEFCRAVSGRGPADGLLTTAVPF